MPVMHKPLPARKEPLAAQPTKFESTGLIKAAAINILLEDGTTLTANGPHAADIYNWLMDCERYCASHPVTIAPYLGPTFNRLDPAGNKISMRKS